MVRMVQAKFQCKSLDKAGPLIPGGAQPYAGIEAVPAFVPRPLYGDRGNGGAADRGRKSAFPFWSARCPSAQRL